MPRAQREGCVLVRRGLMEHYPRLGAAGVALYVYLLLAMDPQERSILTTLSDLAEATGWSVPRIRTTLAKLARSGYITVVSRQSYGIAIRVERPGCPMRQGMVCNLARETAACLAVAESIALASAVSESDTHATQRAIDDVLLFWARHRLPGWVGAGNSKRDREAIAEAIRTYGRESVIAAVERYAEMLKRGEIARRTPTQFFKPLRLATIIAYAMRDEEQKEAADGR